MNQHRGAFIQSPSPRFFVGEAHEAYGLARLDHNFSENHALALRLNVYHYDNTNANDRVGGFNQPSYGRMERTQSSGGQLADRLVFGGVVNDFRVNYTSYLPDSAIPFIPSVGINRPSYGVSGLSTTSWDRAQATDLSDEVAWNRGRHSLQVRRRIRAGHVPGLSTARSEPITLTPARPAEHPTSFTQTFGRPTSLMATPCLRRSRRTTSKYRRVSPPIWDCATSTNRHQRPLHRLGPRAGLAWDVTGTGKTRFARESGCSTTSSYLYVYRRSSSPARTRPRPAYTIPYGIPGFPTFPNSLTAPPTGASAGLINLYLPPHSLLNPYSCNSLSVLNGSSGPTSC